MTTVDKMRPAELVAEYNLLMGKSIKKFATRAVAEQSVEKARKLHPNGPDLTTSTKAEKPAKPAKHELTEAEKIVASHTTVVKNGKKIEPKPYTPPSTPAFLAEQARKIAEKAVNKAQTSSSVKRSEGVTSSWKKPEVAAHRSERHHVEVGGIVFKSVAEAFGNLGLPMSKHIKFRGELKRAGSLTFEHDGKHYTFKVVSK